MTVTTSIKTANQLFQAGKLEDARQEYEKLIQLRPNFSWNYYYLGQVFVQQEKWSDAIAQYRQAIKFNPNSANLYNSLAEALIKEGELDEAINYSQKTISLQPNSVIYNQTLALVYEAKSDFGQALTTWKKVLSLNPNHLKAEQKISWLQTDIAKNCVDNGNKFNKAGQIKEAVEFYQQALILNPEQPMPIYRNCGNNLITLGKFYEAERVFEELIKIYPELPEGYECYAKLTHSFADWNLALERWENAIEKFPEHIDFRRRKGDILISLSRFDQAEVVFQQLIEKFPNQPYGYEGYAKSTHNLANWNLALERWENAIEKFPEHIGFQVQKGNVLINLSRFDEAEVVFQELIEKFPHQPHGYEGYARLNHNLADWNLALEYWENAIEKFPANIVFQVQKGNVLINLSRFDEAEAVFQKLIEKFPHQTHGYEGYARLNHNLADWNLALERWENAIEKFPANIHFQVKKGNLLINLSRFDEAEAVFQRLIEKFPHQTHGYEGYARLNHNLANWNLALERWENAIEKFPEHIGFQVQKGNVLINLSRFDEAEVVFQELIEKFPHQHQGYEGYAKAAQSLPDWELALERWENAVSRLPYHLNFQVQKGNALIKLSHFDEADIVFQDIIAKYPRHHHGYDGYARVANSLPDWELALERWENAIAKLPHHFNFYLPKGDALANLFRYEEAETWWEKVITQYPHRHQALSKSAGLARKLGNREFSWQRFEQMIQKFPWHLPGYCEAAQDLIAMGRFAEAESKFREALERNPNDLTVLLQAGILASQQGNRELALERFERAIEFYHPLKAIDAYVLAARELKYLGRENESEAKYEQILSFHQQQCLYPEIKLLGTRLTSIQELGLLLDRLLTKQPNQEDVVSLAMLTDKILFDSRIYSAPIDKDAPSLLPKLKILRELFGQFLATPDDSQGQDLGIADFGYDLYLLAVTKVLNDKYFRLFSFYFHTLVEQWDEYLLVFKHFNMAVQLLEKESQRLNSSEWGRVKLVRTEIPLPLTNKFCFDGLSSSVQYVIGTDEREPQSEIEARVKYLPGLMDEEKEYFAANVRKFASSLKLRSRQTIEVFKDFICEPPYGVSEGYLFHRYEKRISEEFVKELIDENTSSSIEHIAPDEYMRQMGDTRVTLEEIAIKKTLLDNYYEDDVVFGLPAIGLIWGVYQNYGHVLFDQVPSLVLYHKLNLSCPIFVPHITDLHWEMFGHLDIPKEKILVRQEQKFRYFVICRHEGFHSKETNNFYRNLAKSIVTKRRDIPLEYRARYVYVSRRYSNRRKMANEVEVEELMASLGFLIVYNERLSFEEQAIIMAHASFVVAPYGTSVLNSVMCHPNTAIVLITPPGAPLGKYQFRICSLSEHYLYMLLGEKKGSGWEMNVDKLNRVVSTILESV